VITVCDNARTHCPVYPARVCLLHQPFPDPPRLAQQAPTKDKALEQYRLVRDAIKEWIASLPAVLEHGARDMEHC